MHQLPPFPSGAPFDTVPAAIREGEESEVRTHVGHNHIPQSHYERIMREQQRMYDDNLASQQRRYEMQQARMEPGSVDNNVNPFYGVMDDTRIVMDDVIGEPAVNEHMKKREKAEERAQELLGMIIGEDDLSVYKKTGKLYVKGTYFSLRRIEWSTCASILRRRMPCLLPIT
jgi:hypothetical protein